MVTCIMLTLMKKKTIHYERIARDTMSRNKKEKHTKHTMCTEICSWEKSKKLKEECAI